MIRTTKVVYQFELGDVFVVLKEKEGSVYRLGEFIQITAIRGDSIRLHTSGVVSGRCSGASCGPEWLSEMVEQGSCECIGTLK